MAATCRHLVKAWVFAKTGETDWEVWDWNDDHCVVDTRTSPGTEVCKMEVHDAINQSIVGRRLPEPTWYDPTHIDPRAIDYPGKLFEQAACIGIDVNLFYQSRGRVPHVRGADNQKNLRDVPHTGRVPGVGPAQRALGPMGRHSTVRARRNPQEAQHDCEHPRGSIQDPSRQVHRMSRRVRPNELKTVVNILLEGVADSERTEEMVAEAQEMGTDIIQAIDEARAKRTDWYVIKRDPGVAVSLHGPCVKRCEQGRARSSQRAKAPRRP